MMITIHGLPPNTKYHDIKILLKKECNIIDFILDNLMPDSENSKKVRVGLTDESEGYRLMKCLDGFRIAGTHVLKAVPVGKFGHMPHQNTFEAGPSFSNQQRDKYPNQLCNDYGNQGQRSHGPPSHMSSEPLGRPLPWSASNETNQWVTNQSIGPQIQPNMNHGYGQQQPLHGQRPHLPVRGPQDQSYGFSHKNPEPRFEQPHRPADTRSHVLRAVEPVDTPSRYPPVNQPYPSQDKSMTIMKDNFQGSTQYNTTGQPQGHYQGQGHGQPQSWPQQGHQTKPPQYEKHSYDNDRRPQMGNRPNLKHSQPSTQIRTHQDYEKSGRRFSPRRGSPPGGPISSHGRHTSASRRPVSTERHVPSSGRSISPPGRHTSTSGRLFSAPGRRIASPGRPGRSLPSSGIPISPKTHIPPGRLGSPTGRHLSSPGGHISAIGRNFSQPSMHVSSGRPNPSSGRPVSPSGRRGSPIGKRGSPTGQRVSPPGRRTSLGRREEALRSPAGGRLEGRRDSPRRYSPHKKISPSRRLVSPPRQAMRLSPSRLHPDKPADKYMGSEIVKNSKLVRPAYEPSQASNQAIYSGGYRPNTQNLQYQIPGVRQGDQRMSPWQQDRDKAMYPTSMKKDDDRRDMTRMSNTRAGDRVLSEQTIETKRLHSPVRKSRSPVRRDRSPIRDRYRRHSPSPRSPRRSWALEKRRSPEVREAPPPPIWPGVPSREDIPRHSRSNFPEKDDKKHVVVWNRPAFDDKHNERRRPEDEERRSFGDKIRVRTDLAGRDVSHADNRFPPQNQRDSKFSPRDDHDQDRRSDYRRQDQQERKPYQDREEKREFRDFPPRPADDRRQEEFPPRQQESPRGIEEKNSDFRNIDKDFEDIYNRAVEFRKKAEELRRSGDLRREENSEGRSHHNEEVAKHYNERQQFHREKSPPRHDTRSDRNEGHSRSVEFELTRDRDFEWKTEATAYRRIMLPPAIKAKRDKAVEEISNKILDKNIEFRGEHRHRVAEELKLALTRIVMDMFGVKDVSFIEIVIKYQAKFSAKDEEKILQDVLESMPKQYRNMKRKGPEPSEVAAKSSRRSPRPNSTQKSKAASSSAKQIKTKPTVPEVKKKYVRPDHGIVKPTHKIHTPKPIISDVKSNEEVSLKKAFEVKPPSVDPKLDGHYELNPLMARMVEAELQNIMIKVWQELPDNPSDNAEKFVVDKLRNTAGDDIRNTLGLNVTKRLLNVYNPLYVKINFTSKPESTQLNHFLKQYNITAFKRIETATNTFAAQMKTIESFDAICTAKNLLCGSAHVTVIPCYRFMKCPRNLKTSFDNKNILEMTEMENESKPLGKQENAKIANNTNPPEAKTTVGTKVNENTKADIAKELNKFDSIKITSATYKYETNLVARSKVIEKDNDSNKLTEKLNSDFTNEKHNTVVPIAKGSEIKTVDKREELKETNATKVLERSITCNKNKHARKTFVNVVKTAEPKKETLIEHTREDKKICNPGTSIPKRKDTVKGNKVAKIAKDMNKKKENNIGRKNDFDELDDHDILALISKGIVLDECSGSEDE